MSESEAESAKVKLQTNGDLTITEDGVKTILAKYDKKTGVLEFSTKAFAENDKYRNQIISRICTVAKGTEPSGYQITRFTIKGVESTVAADAPEQPNPDNYVEGDAHADVVQWFLDYDLPGAIARYGIFTDAKGNPIRKKAKRVVVTTVDNRQLDDRDLPTYKQGKGEMKAPVANEGEEIIVDNAVIARRATALTFMPNEVVGGFKPAGYRVPVAINTED